MSDFIFDIRNKDQRMLETRTMLKYKTSKHSIFCFQLNTPFCLIFALSLCSSTQAQVAGTKAFAFLNMAPSARQVGLGSNFISSFDKDLSQAYNNPASLNELSHNHFIASYNNYISDIGSGYFAYARDYGKKGTFAAGVLYVDYGTFNGYTEAGIANGTFTAKDQCFHISYGRKVNDRIRLGANFKYIYSIYESFVSNGLSSDLSAMYSDSSGRLIVTAFARNIGFQAIPYSGTERQGLPMELAITISKKLEHLPFRYQLILNNLQRPDMRYTIEETNEKDENGNTKVKTMSMGDNILRHIALGGELNLSKNFVLRFGYNHNKRKEMNQEQKKGVSGFSWGLGFRVSKFHLSYGSAAYFPGYNINQFSLLFNLSDFYKVKKK
jgi:hypothetical protein